MKAVRLPACCLMMSATKSPLKEVAELRISSEDTLSDLMVVGSSGVVAPMTVSDRPSPRQTMHKGRQRTLPEVLDHDVCAREGKICPAAVLEKNGELENPSSMP